MQIAQRTARRISEARDILVVCHVSPDGDAIGSLLGLGLGLEQLQKRVTLACADPVPNDCRHLPHWEAILALHEPGIRRRLCESPSAFDLLITLDCSDVDRVGAACSADGLNGAYIINIDHHPTNTLFGEINWVDPSAAATAQLVVQLIAALGVSYTTDMATCLLNGLVTDTLGFRTSNTDAEVVETATLLIKAGASLSDLTEQIFNHRPINTIRMWSAALQNIHLIDRILWCEITQEMRQSTGYQDDGDAGLASFLNTANEADIAVVFDELRDGQINVSMRCAPGHDVSRVALSLGGGGHAQAAGCTLSGPIESARSTVLNMLRSAENTRTP